MCRNIIVPKGAAAQLQRLPEQRRIYVIEGVDVEDGIQAATDSAGDYRHHATVGHT